MNEKLKNFRKAKSDYKYLSCEKGVNLLIILKPIGRLSTYRLTFLHYKRFWQTPKPDNNSSFFILNS